jgi:hypothetical protein
MKTPDLIAALNKATIGSHALDREIFTAVGWLYVEPFTTSFSAACRLLPPTTTNFHLFSFGGHGRSDVDADCWGCHVHDRAQLVGKERAKHQVKRLSVSFTISQGPKILLEKAIAEQFCDFGSTHLASAPLAVCVVALKVRIGLMVDDELWAAEPPPG